MYSTTYFKSFYQRTEKNTNFQKTTHLMKILTILMTAITKKEKQRKIVLHPLDIVIENGIQVCILKYSRNTDFSNNEINKENIISTLTTYSGNNLKLVARCEHDAVAQGTNNELVFLTTKALNEWDSRYICDDSVSVQFSVKI